MKKKVVELFTDGSITPKQKCGGWAAVLRYKDKKQILKGGELDTTINRMELLAVINGVKALTEPCRVHIYTDSQYISKNFNWLPNWKANSWRKIDGGKVKNVDLWQIIDQLSSVHELCFYWVRGHNGNEKNEEVDKLANEARIETFTLKEK